MTSSATAVTSLDTEPHPFSRWIRRNSGKLLAGILAFSVAVDLFFYMGYFANDDFVYFNAATSLIENGTLGDEGIGPGQNPQTGRLVLLGWSTLVALIFGANIHVIAGSFIVFHLLLTVFTFLIGRRLFSESAGLVAAYYVATMPLIVVYAACIYTDIPVTCFIVLSFLLFTYAYDHKERGRLRASSLWMCAAGLAVGLAYMVKESGLIMLPFYFGLWVWKEISMLRAARSEASPAGGRTASALWAMRSGGLGTLGGPLKTGLMFALGFFVVFAAEGVILAALFDRPFFRLSWTLHSTDLGGSRTFQVHGGADPVERLRVFYHNLNAMHFPATLKALFLGSLLIFPFMRRKKWSVVMAGLWIFAFHTWGTTSFTQYHPPTIHPRYFITVIPFLCLILGFVFTGADRVFATLPISRKVRAPLQVCAVAVMVLIPLFNLDVADRFAGRGSRASFVGSATKAIDVAREAARETGGPVVLSEVVSIRMRPVFHRGRPPGLLMAEELTGEDIGRLLASGGFYYIDNNETSLLFPGGRRSNPVDDLLHGIVLTRGGQWDPWRPPGTTKVRLASGTALQPPEASVDPDLILVKLANFSARRSRLSEVAACLFRTVPQELESCDHSWSADLYRVFARKRDLPAGAEDTAVSAENRGLTWLPDDD